MSRWPKPKFDTFHENFWNRVDHGSIDRCWNWKGPQGKKYYGQAYGQTYFRGRTTTAHRVAWQLAFLVQPRVLVLHHCDNRLCCNPSHLFLGTHLDNAKDRDSKGRGATGDRNGMRIKARLLRAKKLSA